jgi:hypothetical protein|tara:strand:+ start:1257 stop:1565 length:309 start_codon:yes stop_codon:yes gene_type:complete
MKKISDIIPNSDAYKSLEKRKRDTSITEDVTSIQKLAREIYEVSSKKYCVPLWFEIRKDDYEQDSNMWQSQLDYLGIEADCNVVTLKVVAYVEHDPLYDAPC